MQILLFSTLYPNSAQPHHALFVEQRLLHLIKDADVGARVVAPVPWFPFKNDCFGKYATFAKVPKQEERNGVTIYHPRYLVIPKIGMTLAPFLMFLCSLPLIWYLARDKIGFKLIDSHFLYPDGIAAILLGKTLSKPVTVTCRGSDVNLHMRFGLPYRITRCFLRRAKHVITVCQALKNELTCLKLDIVPITVLRNGVDTDVFHPVDRETARKVLNVNNEVWISVGRLAELKGHHLTIEALAKRPGATLMLLGDGSERENLIALTKKLDVVDRVKFFGNQPQAELKKYYCAADVMVLASSREGWANVLLESMACGTPIVATDVGGTSEVIDDNEFGVLINERSSEGILHAIDEIFNRSLERENILNYAKNMDWRCAVEGQVKIFTASITDT